MTSFEIGLIVCVCILLIVCIALAVWNIRQIKKVKFLQKSISEFMESGKITDFSVGENSFAQLQNSISDLENRIRLEKSNTISQTKKNTEFISDISHQLKTPLAGMRLYCEMQNAEDPTEYTKKELQLIERMESLIQKLFKLEKIRSDSYVMDFKSWEIRDIVNELISEFHHLFPNKAYSINGSSELRCDRAWMAEAVGNIIKNASEHTADDGEVNVNIENRNHSTIIEVNDNGGGIDPEEIPNLFKRFYRTEHSAPGSAGIGLPVTKAIVEKHHGIITVENKNDGLSVVMCFPHIDGYVTI